MISRAEKAARLELAMLPGVGFCEWRRLMEVHGGAQQALDAGRTRWEAVSPQGRGERPGRSETWKRLHRPRIIGGRRGGEELLSLAEELGCTVLTWGEEGYPALLCQTREPPPVLFVRGSLAGEDWRAIAVVGTRRASGYGRFHAERLAGELVAEGFTVVSGLARGIDEAAHRGALRAGGRTLAVLGCGPDRVYPAENSPLAEEIARQGAVLTEFPPGVPPLPENFLWRNRLIAGLALATVVVEAGERSGAINTALHASDAGREVFAVPGEVGRLGSAGCHALLRAGATLLEQGRQVTEELSPILPPGLWYGPAWRRGPIGGADWWRRGQEGAKRGEGVSSPNEALWRALQESPGRVEDLAARVGLPVGAVAAQLVLWELEGKVREYPDGRVARATG